MVLPGIQALFGFQLIVVFNLTFSEKFSTTKRGLHWTDLIIVAIAMVMVPVAYHQQRDPQSIGENFVFVATRLLLSHSASDHKQFGSQSRARHAFSERVFDLLVFTATKQNAPTFPGGRARRQPKRLRPFNHLSQSEFVLLRKDPFD